jgi:hypothetical protein
MLASPLFQVNSPSTFIDCNNSINFEPTHRYKSTTSDSSSASGPCSSRIPRRSNQNPYLSQNRSRKHMPSCSCHPKRQIARPDAVGSVAAPPATASRTPPVGWRPTGTVARSPYSPLLKRGHSMELDRSHKAGLGYPSTILLPENGARTTSPTDDHSMPFEPPPNHEVNLSNGHSSSCSPPSSTPTPLSASIPPFSPLLTPKSQPSQTKTSPPLHLTQLPPSLVPPVRVTSKPPPQSATSPLPRRRKSAYVPLLKKVILRRFSATEHGREIRRRGAHAGVLYLQTLAAARAFVVEFDFACPGLYHNHDSREVQNMFEFVSC